MNKKVLLIDSDPDSLEQLQRPLAEAGYEVVVATNGAQGIEEFRRVAPDLAVVDAALAGEDGFVVCQELKSSPTGNNTPILVLHDTTACEVTDPDVREASGCDEYAEKPLLDRELLEICRRLLEARESGLSGPTRELGQQEMNVALETLESIIDFDADDDRGEVARACAAGDFSDLMEELADGVATSPPTAPAIPKPVTATTTPAARIVAVVPEPDEAGSDIAAQLDFLFTSGRPEAGPVAPIVATAPSPTAFELPEDAPLDLGDEFAIDHPERFAESSAPVLLPVIEQPAIGMAQTDVLAGAELPRVPVHSGRSRLPFVAAVVVIVLGGAPAFFLLRGGGEGGLPAGDGVDARVETPAVASDALPVSIPGAGLLMDSGVSPESVATVEPTAPQVATEPSSVVAEPKPDRVASLTTPAAGPVETISPPVTTPSRTTATATPAIPSTTAPARATATSGADTSTENVELNEGASGSSPRAAAAPATSDPTHVSRPDTAINETTAGRVNTDSAGSTVAEAPTRPPLAATPLPVTRTPVVNPSETETAAAAVPEVQTPIAAAVPSVVQSVTVSEPSPPVALARVEPAFPARALKRAGGTSVDLRVLVGPGGRVVRVVVKDGSNPDPELVTAAIDAVLRTKYQPAMQDGVPVKGWAEETFVFDP